MKRKTLTIIGIAMLLFGSGVLIYRDSSITGQKTVLDMGSPAAKSATKEQALVPASLGWFLIVGGVLARFGGAMFKAS